MNINAIVPAQRKFIPLWKWLPFEEKATISPRGASLCFKKLKISFRHVAAVQKIQTKQLLSLQAKDRLVHRRLPCNNSREITPPGRELCRILDHSSLLIQPPVPLLPLQDLQRRKNLRPFKYQFNSCGYTSSFYRGKRALYLGKLTNRVWPPFPRVNLTWCISMDTSKRTKESPMTLTEVNR